MTSVVAVDIGGTQMRAGLVDESGLVTDRVAIPTADAPSGGDGLHRLITQLPCPPDAHAVVGLPGRIDYGLGRLETGFNLPEGWVDEFRESPLSASLGRPVHLANDADMAAVGETWFGAGRGHDDVVYVTISTGVGAGIVLGRRLVCGRRSAAELGHTVIDLEGPHTVEDLGSGTALGAAAAEAGLPLGAELVELVRAGDPAATAVWDRSIRAAAVGIANLCWLAAPTVVVVGGGVGRNGELTLEPIRAAIAQLGPADLAESTVVAEAGLGDDAGLAGAAAWLEARGID